MWHESRVVFRILMNLFNYGAIYTWYRRLYAKRNKYFFIYPIWYTCVSSLWYLGAPLDLECWFNKIWSMLHSQVHVSSSQPRSWDSLRGTWSEGGCICGNSVSLPENLLTVDFIWRSPWFLGTGVSWSRGKVGYVWNIRGAPSSGPSGSNVGAKLCSSWL